MKELLIDGVEHPLRPLSFAALRRHGADIKAMVKAEWESTDALFAAMAGIVHSSLLRSAPSLTLEQVEEALDWPTAEAAVNEVLTCSFPQAAPGESRAESPSGPSTGTAPSPS